MYRGFDLKVSENFFSDFLDIGSTLHKKNKNLIPAKINSFQDQDGNLLAANVAKTWFPQIDSEVFISHAHKDGDLALGLAGSLHKNFGVSSFIDSTVWGYADDLLKMIENEFCYNEKSKNYNYSKRNRSTAHVNMMLSIALSEMINKCECVMFLNNPASISAKSYIEELTTQSPWIFSEIAMTRLIQKRSPEAHRIERSVIAMESMAADAKLRMRYDVHLDHLCKMDNIKYKEWMDSVNQERGEKALDVLYSITGHC